jgi:alpha-mannosidase
MLISKRIVLFIAGLLFLSSVVPRSSAATAAGAQGRVVFRIGSFDRSSIEFAQGDPKQPVHFVVGKSDAAKDWYATQPAPLAGNPGNAGAAIATAPREIVFTLNHTPAPVYHLHVSLLIETASVPALQIEINGKHGRFYLHPKLDYSNGDQGDSFYPAFSQADVAFAIPGSALRQGSNTIRFQVVEEADNEVPEASLTYDAIELDSGDADVSLRSSAEIQPTIFFQQRQGVLHENVDAFIRYGKPTKAGSSVELSVLGKHYHQALRGEQDFGEEKVEFAVPEFPAETKAELVWDADGHKQRREQTIDPKKKWTLFVVPHIHVDVGYSDLQSKVAVIQAHAIDEAMDMTVQHPDFRFSLDGEWDLEQFLKTRSLAQQERAMTAIKNKQLFVPAQYANLLTGFPAAETLIRSLYPSANLSRMHGTPFNYANITDVPSYSWSYASVLAAAGIHYLAGGSNNYRAPVLLQGKLNEASPMWWVGPDGGKVLLWYSRIYQQMQMLFGLPPVLAAGHDTLPLFLQMYERPGYRANAAMVYGTQVENSDLFPQQAELADNWNSIYAYPHLQYAGFHEALANIEQQFGKDIPTIRGDGAPYWEDGMASDAYFSGLERWTEARATTAEKLATLTSLVNPVMKADTTDLDTMWTNMVLMDEHTWDSYNSVSAPTSTEAVQQLAIKDQYAVKASAIADFVTRSSLASIANSIPTAPGSLILFNSLNWKRDGLVSVDLNDGDAILDATTRQVLPYEIVSSGSGFTHVRLMAKDIPALGYKVFEMQPAAKPVAATTETEQTTTLESPFYKMVLDAATGAVRSIYDKQLQRELVDQQSPYRFAQYLYVTGGDKAPNTILQYSRVYPKADLQVHAASDGHLVSVTRTPYGWVARMTSDDINTPSITTEIRLFEREKKIEFVEDVDKKEVTSKEAVYFAFPFAMKQPEFRYEIQNGVVDPARDLYPGAGHEWFSLQHWVSVQQDGVSGTVMPLDASLVTLGDINRGEWPETFGTRTGTIFSYVMNNYWDTNYRAEQGGYFHFHYVVTSASSIDPPALSRMGWNEITPLESDIVTTQDKSRILPEHNRTLQYPATAAHSGFPSYAEPLDGKQGSFLAVDDPDLLLETWKAAEDGKGSILRFLDLGGAERTVRVRTPLLHIEAAWQTDAVERDQAPLPLLQDKGFTFTVHPHEIVTVRVTGTSTIDSTTRRAQ